MDISDSTKLMITLIALCVLSLIVLIIIIVVINSSKKFKMRFKSGDYEGEIGLDESDRPNIDKKVFSDEKTKENARRYVDYSSINPEIEEAKKQAIKKYPYLDVSYVDNARIKFDYIKILNHRFLTNTLNHLSQVNIEYTMYDEAISAGIKSHDTKYIANFKKYIGSIYIQDCFLKYFKLSMDKWIRDVVAHGREIVGYNSGSVTPSLFEIFNILNNWEDNISKLAYQKEFNYDGITFSGLPRIFVSKMNTHIEPMIKKLIISVEKVIYNDNTNWFGKTCETLDLFELQFYNIPYVLNAILIILNGDIENFIKEQLDNTKQR